MNFEIALSEKAQQEILQATQWYEEKQQGLGLRFSTILFSQLDKISHNPNAYTERRKNHREAKVPQFPYLIVYRIAMKRKTILIASVFHTSRSTKANTGDFSNTTMLIFASCNKPCSGTNYSRLAVAVMPMIRP